MNEDNINEAETYDDTATDKVSYDLEQSNDKKNKSLDLSDVDTSLTPMSEPLSTDTIAMSKQTTPQTNKQERKIKISCFRCGQKLDLSDMQPFSKVMCPSCDNLLIVPKWFDNYLLEEQCGIGGMANVYRGLDLALDREVAIKILNDGIADSTKTSKLFLHEARTAATLNHYAILPIYTCGTFEDQPYIVMQYMAKGSLEKKLQELEPGSFFDFKKIIKWLHDATEGLENARRHGIIHHDIKPANLMLDEDGQLKIGDFGIAQALHDSKSEEILELTKSLCSPDYVSPEKLLTGEEDHYGDIYSLGVSFYQIITKQTLFPNLNPAEVLKVKVLDDPEDIKNIRQDTPPKLAKLIMSMLAKKPEDRPSYTEIIKHIESIHDKTKKPASKSVKATSNKSKKVQQKNNEKGKQKLKKAVQEKNYIKKTSIKDIIPRIILLVVLFFGGIYLWKSGFFKIQEEAPAIQIDYLPDVTRQLSKGNANFALKLVSEALKRNALNKTAMKQASLQKGIASYLNREVNASSENDDLANKLKSYGIPKDDPAVIILSFLSSPSLPSEKLIELLEGDPYYTYIGNVAIFLRGQYNQGEKNPRNQAISDLMHQNENPLDFWGFHAFATRIPVWKEAFVYSKTDLPNLEKLFIPKNLKVNEEKIAKEPTKEDKKETVAISTPEEKGNKKTLSSAWLKANREYAKNRPHPDALNFNKKLIQKYLDSLPSEFVDIEAERLEQISNLKNHIVQMMLHLPYGKTAIKKKNGQLVVGKIMTGPKYISVKTSNGKRERIYWKDIHIDQFIAFLEHYALFRKNAQLSGQITRKATTKKRNETAWEYLRIAILCDWFGKYNDAVRYARKAIAIDPKIQKDAMHYLVN